MKIVYFATGAPEAVAADLKRLKTLAPDSLRVIAPPAIAQQVRELASLQLRQVLSCSPALALVVWFRLWMFLRLTPDAEVICLKSPQRFRLLKLLAVALRGKVAFSDGKGTLTDFDVKRLLWFRWVRLREMMRPAGPVCVIGSASSTSLNAILLAVRRRYPEAPLYGVLPAAAAEAIGSRFDSSDRFERLSLAAYLRLLPRCFGRNRFQAVVLPCTNERGSAFKYLAWWLPISHIQAYNENGGAFSGRNLYLLAQHIFWRNRQQRGLRRQRREILREEKKKQFRSLPVGVVGSASGLYLEKIVPVVRAAFPEATRIHGLLPADLEAPAAKLFDSSTILSSGFAAAFWQACRLLASQRFQCWVIPCTDEPYELMKLLAVVLPLSRRHIYNEMADGYPVRKLGTLYRHLAWRLREHLSFQIIAGTAERNWALRLLHLLVYTLRLLSVAPLLWKTCRRPAVPRERVAPIQRPADAPTQLEAALKVSSAAVVSEDQN